MHRRQSFDTQQRHIPIRMDHGDCRDVQDLRLRGPKLTHEVDSSMPARGKSKSAVAEPLGENFRDVPVRHQKVRADDKCCASVGGRRVTRQFHTADGRKGSLDASTRLCIVQGQPVRMLDLISPVDDIHRRTAVGNNDRLHKDLFLFVEITSKGKLFKNIAPLPRKRRSFSS